jgi:hypothetical protein
MSDAVCLLPLITVFFQLATNSRIFQHSLYHMVSYKHERDTEKSNRNHALCQTSTRALETTQRALFSGVKRSEHIADHKLDTQLS